MFPSADVREQQNLHTLKLLTLLGKQWLLRNRVRAAPRAVGKGLRKRRACPVEEFRPLIVRAANRITAALKSGSGEANGKNQH